MRTLGQYIEAWKRDTVRACTPQPHHIDCHCEQCCEEAFGPLDAMPPDVQEQVDARYGDLGLDARD